MLDDYPKATLLIYATIRIGAIEMTTANSTIMSLKASK